MPWCDDCGRFLNPNSARADGSCPSCGRTLAAPAGPGAHQPDDRAGEGSAAAAPDRVPWHFWLLLAALVVYLGWRAVQGVDWLARLL